MKKLAEYLLIMAVVALFAYAWIGFIIWDWRIWKWTMGERLLVSCFTFVSVVWIYLKVNEK